LRFLIDAQLLPALGSLLSMRGHLAEHVNDVGMGDASDRDLLRYALDHEAMIVTKDEDFATLITVGSESPPVIWVRVGNTRRAALLAWFEPLIDQIVSLVEAGNRLIELRCGLPGARGQR
jgi:predicted nuclease of predicted toxin-antitoxin system